MKKIILLIVCISLLFSCSQEESQENTDMLTVEDTVIDSQQEQWDQSQQGDVETDSESLDLSTTSFTWNGTEPFWWFSASGSTFILREPSDTGPMATTTFTGVTITNSGTSVNMVSADMNLDLVLGSCSDGMSDLVYTYSSSFTAGALSYTGCANID